MKKLNKKGFTLVELLAVIVILAILVAVAIPAISGYLLTARKGTYANNVNEAIQAVRNDSIIGATTKTYNLEDINKLLQKKLETSPFNSAFDTSSKIVATYNATTNDYVYTVCITDNAGNGFYNSAAGDHTVGENTITSDSIKMAGGTGAFTVPATPGNDLCTTTP